MSSWRWLVAITLGFVGVALISFSLGRRDCGLVPTADGMTVLVRACPNVMCYSDDQCGGCRCEKHGEAFGTCVEGS